MIIKKRIFVFVCLFFISFFSQAKTIKVDLGDFDIGIAFGNYHFSENGKFIFIVSGFYGNELMVYNLDSNEITRREMLENRHLHKVIANNLYLIDDEGYLYSMSASGEFTNLDKVDKVDKEHRTWNELYSNSDGSYIYSTSMFLNISDSASLKTILLKEDVLPNNVVTMSKNIMVRTNNYIPYSNDDNWLEVIDTKFGKVIKTQDIDDRISKQNTLMVLNEDVGDILYESSEYILIWNYLNDDKVKYDKRKIDKGDLQLGYQYFSSIDDEIFTIYNVDDENKITYRHKCNIPDLNIKTDLLKHNWDEFSLERLDELFLNCEIIQYLEKVDENDYEGFIVNPVYNKIVKADSDGFLTIISF